MAQFDEEVRPGGGGFPPREMRIFQRRGILHVVFPTAHPYVVNCCANDSLGMEREEMVALMRSKWLPMHDKLVAERRELVKVLESNPPSCYGDEEGAGAAPAPKKEKKKKSRLQGAGGGSLSKPRAKPSASAGGEWANAGDSNAVAVTRPVTSRPAVDVIRPGLVVMKKILPMEVQQHFVDASVALGTPKNGKSGGWYHVNEATGEKRLNGDGFGQMHEGLDTCPQQFKELCNRYMRMANANSPELPLMNADLVLLNFYTPDKPGIYWHRDNSGNERRACELGLPVVSFSFGDSCVFAWKDESEDPDKELVLDSGDVLLFGGPSRMILHAVPKIYPNTCPKNLKMPPGRLNLTFRQQLNV
eukprot:TRINITY_DN10089_c0_g1_i8.p1 TRINITY_DN10089_c0_g1~~TRINITY_DN10089_c0_g1_i8.p1  ORF type:complete len:360 (+),score=124.43 TRINITY_DN10089_c0_g1_i8:108-1187(+)